MGKIKKQKRNKERKKILTRVNEKLHALSKWRRHGKSPGSISIPKPQSSAC